MASTEETRTALAERRNPPPAPAPVGDADNIRVIIQRQADELALVLPEQMDSERFARLIVNAVKATPKLLLSMGTVQGRQSVLLAAMEAATIGLEPNTPLQHAWLVPRRGQDENGDRIWEARLWLGYRGLLTLMRRSNTVRELVADVVHDGDVFAWSRELDRDHLRHGPGAGDRGAATQVYAIARMLSGGTQFVVLTRADVEARRDMSDGWKDEKSRPYSPWTKWPASMWRKSAVRALVPWLDLTPDTTAQVSSALAADAANLRLTHDRAAVEAVDVAELAAAPDDQVDTEPTDDPGPTGPEPGTQPES